MNKLGFIIINYNDYQMTKRLIDNICNYKIIDKILIVDNCSSDDSFEKLKKIENKKISVVKTNKNNGYAAGLNYGAKELMKKDKNWNIIFSNADIIIKNEKVLKELVNNISDEIKVVGPTIEEHGTLNRGWKMTTPTIEILSNLPLISRYFKKKLLNYNDSYYKNDITYVDVISGCFFLVNGSFLDEIKYFDENVFLYYEEFILSHKTKQKNKKIVVNNIARIIHDHSVTIDKNVKRINKYKILKQSQNYFVKNYLKANKIKLLLLFITNKISLIILYIRCFLRITKQNKINMI